MVYALRIQTGYLYTVVATPLDGDLNKVSPVDESWDGGAVPYSLYGGRPVKIELLPKRMRWSDARYKIPDFDSSGSHVGVSERAKALIERFEPGVHQFVPADYYAGKGKLLERRHFLYVCNRIDCLDHDKTTMVLITRHVSPAYARPGKEWSRRWTSVFDLTVRGETTLIPPHLLPDTKSKYVFSRGQIGAHHMWCDKFGLSGIWISDELAHGIRGADLTGVNLNDDVAKKETI
jgi:hypothetical protein